MGNLKKRQEKKLKDRRQAFDEMRNTDGFTRPGSLNRHKQRSDGSGASPRRPNKKGRR